MRADGGRDVGRVQAAEHEMPGFGRRQRNAHRFVIAHLADDEHVGRLADGAAQRGRKVGRVLTDLDLLDERPLVLMLVFDRILDGDDVLARRAG